jgi:hypothetical protein
LGAAAAIAAIALSVYRGNVEPTIRKRDSAMPQKERLRVYLGELKKTSGGLTRDDLVKNKRGKIVSRKKSGQAVGDANNLGSWLRGKGDQFKGKPKGYKEQEEKDADEAEEGCGAEEEEGCGAEEEEGSSHRSDGQPGQGGEAETEEEEEARTDEAGRKERPFEGVNRQHHRSAEARSKKTRTLQRELKKAG